MFNLDIFECDFDDDFSSNIFNKNNSDESNTNFKKHKTENLSPEETLNLNRSEVFKRPTHTSNESLNDQQSKKIKYNLMSSNAFMDSSLIKEFNINSSSIQPSLKRSIFEDENPVKKKLSNDGLLQRKFPGPAGLLPDKPFKEIEDFSFIGNKSTNIKINETEKNETVIYSQSSGSVFLESAYQKLVLDFDLNESNNPLNKYTVEWVKKTATNKALYGRKIPFLAVILHCINHSTLDPVLLLRDPTGEINGSLHREVWADLGGKLKTGIALALRQVGVLITGVIRRQIYLNITLNNILAVYSPSETENEVEITNVNKVLKADLFKSIKDWQAQILTTPLQESTKNSKSSLFSTVANLESHEECLKPHTNSEEINNLRNKLQNFLDGSNKQNDFSCIKVQSEKVEEKNSDQVLANLGIIFTDSDFSDNMNIPEHNSALGKKSKKEVSEPEFKFDLPLKDKPGLHKINSTKNSIKKNKTGSFQLEKSTQVLSQAETLIFEEVLSGINLDEFEM